MLRCLLHRPVTPPSRARLNEPRQGEQREVDQPSGVRVLATTRPANTEVARKSFGSRFGAADFDHIDMDC